VSLKVTTRARYTFTYDHALEKLEIPFPDRDKDYRIVFGNNEGAGLVVVDVYTEEEKTLGEVETFEEKERQEP
jgi:hypothetical protein